MLFLLLCTSTSPPPMTLTPICACDSNPNTERASLIRVTRCDISNMKFCLLISSSSLSHVVTSCFGKKSLFFVRYFALLLFFLQANIIFSMRCPVAPLAVITAYPHVFASVSLTRDQLCFSIAQSAAWWMRLSVAQVRRHPWWDGPTVHYSTASSVLLPFRASLCFPLCCHTWQMANGKKTFPNILRFFSFPLARTAPSLFRRW